MFGRIAFEGAELQNLHYRWPRIQNYATATNLDGFNTAEAELLKDVDEERLGRRKIAGGARASGS
jgi:hypothetical protein